MRNAHGCIGASDASLFGRTAAVVWYGSNVTDDSDLKTHRLHGAHRRFPACAGAFHADFNFPETVAHGLLAGILGDHLGGVGRALARALKTAFSGPGPANDGAFLVRDADNGVVKAGLNVSNAMNDVLAALGLDDLQGLDVVIKRMGHTGGSPFLLVVLLCRLSGRRGRFGFLRTNLRAGRWRDSWS